MTAAFAISKPPERIGCRMAGSGKVEFVVRILIGAILALVLLERFFYYQELAEKTVMEATLTNMRSGMRLRIADLMTQNRSSEIAGMLDENPITWLERPPADYRGILGAGGAKADGWYV
ncbi:MAG: hypothetical protein JSS58_02515, partial [Proteobacteria bacterium]|nr:hypothetical protein [Pseudomonadota bacterium]